MTPKKKPTPRKSVQFGPPPAAPAHPGRAGNPISLAPMTPDEAVSRIARVRLADVKALEAAEKKAKGKK